LESFVAAAALVALNAGLDALKKESFPPTVLFSESNALLILPLIAPENLSLMFGKAEVNHEAPELAPPPVTLGAPPLSC
jgi:hypothetical protein